MKKLGGRKVVISLLLVAVGAAVDLLTARGLSDNLLYLLLAVGGGFIVGNTAVHVAYRKIGGTAASMAPPSPPQIDTEGLDKKIQALSNRQELSMQTLQTIGQAVNHIIVAAGLNKKTE